MRGVSIAKKKRTPGVSGEVYTVERGGAKHF